MPPPIIPYVLIPTKLFIILFCYSILIISLVSNCSKTRIQTLHLETIFFADCISSYNLILFKEILNLYASHILDILTINFKEKQRHFPTVSLANTSSRRRTANLEIRRWTVVSILIMRCRNSVAELYIVV